MPFLVPAVVAISAELAVLLTVSRQTSKPLSPALPAPRCQQEWGRARSGLDRARTAAQAGENVPRNVSKHEDTSS